MEVTRLGGCRIEMAGGWWMLDEVVDGRLIVTGSSRLSGVVVLSDDRRVLVGLSSPSPVMMLNETLRAERLNYPM